MVELYRLCPWACHLDFYLAPRRGNLPSAAATGAIAEELIDRGAARGPADWPTRIVSSGTLTFRGYSSYRAADRNCIGRHALQPECWDQLQAWSGRILADSLL